MGKKGMSEGRVWRLLLLGMFTSCGGQIDDDELESRSGCDTLDPSICALPFPSSYFLATDDKTPTGYRVNFGEQALPADRDGVQTRPDFWNEKDGFSVNSHIMAFFPELSPEGLLSWTKPGDYLLETATTVIIDAETGERVPHFAEIDANVNEASEAVLLLRPTVVLEHNRRYIVGIRGLKTQTGDPVDSSEDFRALRDGLLTRRQDVESRRAHFEQTVFPSLASTGFARADLQLAWDFHTVSQENSIGRMLWIRDDAYSRYSEGGPAYAITNVEDSDCNADGQSIARTIYGTVTVPLYTEIDGPGTYLTRDASGMPYYNGDTQAEFMVRVPCSVATEPGPAAILQYGHGLLGGLGEGRNGYLGELIDEQRWVLIAMNWTGMYDEDVYDIVLMSASDVSRFAFIPERSMQGFVEKLAGMRMMMGDFADDPAMQFPDANGVLQSVIDDERRYYYGNSQGAILGGALVALSPDIQRAVLGVGGFPYAMLLSRSSDFVTYFMLFKEKFPDSRDVSLLVNGLIQQLWDPGESAGYAYAMNRDPLPGTEAKEVLIQVAYGDPQVSTLGSRVMARAYGAKSVAPAIMDVYGVEEAVAPFQGSAYVEWSYPDGATIPVDNLPPEGADAHECPRREPEAIDQLTDFLATGTVNQYCEGACEGLVAACP